MTYLELINKVLIRLREDEVTTYSETSYSRLIGEFVNQAKREVEDAHDWTVLRSYIDISTSASTSTYSLTGINNRARIKYILNNTDDVVMRMVPHNYMYQLQNIGTPQEDSPIYYIFEGETSNVPNITVWPIPDNTYSIRVFGHIPQDDLANNTTELSAPDLPVILGAYALALSERGEDGGNRFDETMALYDKTLGDYIAIDKVRTQSEDEWEVV